MKILFSINMFTSYVSKKVQKSLFYMHMNILIGNFDRAGSVHFFYSIFASKPLWFYDIFLLCNKNIKDKQSSLIVLLTII